MDEDFIGLGMIGCGTVGTGVVKLLQENNDLYARRLGKSFQVRRILVRDVHRRRDPVVDPATLTSAADDFFATENMPILIEVAGGCDEVAGHVRRALEASKHVITANKSLLASDGPQLSALARRRRCCIAFEASCGGGIPIVTALQYGLMSNRIQALYGILSGTCNYVLSEMTQRGKSLDEALGDAQLAGLAEADPALDIGGRDAAQKLAVLASLAFGRCVGEDQVWCEGIDQIDPTDIRFAAELGYEIKLLAIAEQFGDDEGRLSLRVHPSFVHDHLPLAQVRGAYNAISVYGHASGHTMYYGHGAGQMPTASAVVSDLINVASGWYPWAFTHLSLWCDRHDAARTVDFEELISRYYLRISALDQPGVMAKVSQILGNSGISVSALMQHEVAAGQFVPVVIVTHRARQGSVYAALRSMEQLAEVDGKPVCVRIVDFPDG